MKRVLLIIAIIIFANPLISNVDIAPDFIGYLLIMIAFFKSTYHDQRAMTVYRHARNMLFVSTGRLISVYFSTIIVDDTISLVFSFTFFVLELIFGIPFLIKLVDYSSDIAMREDNKKAMNSAGATKIVLIILLIVRLLLSTLPDFVLLTMRDPISLYQDDYSRFRPVLILFALVLSLPVMVTWLIIGIRFFVRVFTKEESESSNKVFEENVKFKSLQFNIRANYIAYLMLGILSLSIFEIEIDHKTLLINSVLPIALILISVFLMVKKYIKPNVFLYALLPTTAIQLILNVYTHKRINAYFSEYTLLDVMHSSRADTLYYQIPPLMFITSIFFMGCTSLMLLLIIKNAKDALYSELPVVLPNADMEFTMKEYKKRVVPLGIVTTVVGALNALLSPVAFTLMPRIEEFYAFNFLGAQLSFPIFSFVIGIFYLARASFVVLFIATIIVVNQSSYKKLQDAITLK